MLEMTITNYDLCRVASGDHPAMMCEFTTGEEGLLRRDGARLDPESLAERRALEDGLPIVPLTGDDIRVIAGGDTALVLANDPGAGSYRVLVRLMTADELLEAHAKARAAEGMSPSMSREQAETLTRHL